MIKPLAKAVRCNIVDFPCCASENSLLSVLGNRPLSYAAATKFLSIEAMARLRSCEIPCFFPVKQGIFARDGFAQDWPLRHLARISAAFFRLAVPCTESSLQRAGNWLRVVMHSRRSPAAPVFPSYRGVPCPEPGPVGCCVAGTGHGPGQILQVTLALRLPIVEFRSRR